jgi:hypothetical protein
MPYHPHELPAPTPDSDGMHDRQTDRAPPWNCDAPTRSERGSARTLPSVQAIDTTGGDAADAVIAESQPPFPSAIALDLVAPSRPLDNLIDDFETADTR